MANFQNIGSVSEKFFLKYIIFFFVHQMSGSPYLPKNSSNSLNTQQINSAFLNNYSTDELKSILKKLQSQHDIMEVKNEELATHISDMRSVIKHVEKEKAEQLEFMLEKKAALQNQIQRCEAALKVANSSKNTMYQDMVAFKDLSSDH